MLGAKSALPLCSAHSACDVRQIAHESDLSNVCAARPGLPVQIRSSFLAVRSSLDLYTSIEGHDLTPERNVTDIGGDRILSCLRLLGCKPEHRAEVRKQITPQGGSVNDYV